jgi:glycosyltransferase involved in cell wall biosynthesis
MKIIYVENVRVPSERAHAYQIVQTCAWLARFGHDVTLVNPDRAGGMDISSVYGIPQGLFHHLTLRAWDPLTSWKGMKKLAYALQRWAFTRALRKWARTQTAEVWMTRDTAMIDALRGVVRGSWILEHHDVPTATRWKRIASRVIGNVAISNGLAEALKGMGIPADRLTVAHDGYDPDEFHAPMLREDARHELGVPPNAFVVMYTGSFYAWKGVDLVVRAWAKTDANAHLVLIGGPDADRKRIESLIPDEAKDRVHLFPTQPRAKSLSLLSAADAGLLSSSPSSSIGKLYTSPLKQFEYLAAGLPLLASDVPSSHEILDNNVALFYPPTEQGVVQAVADLTARADWRAEAHKTAPSIAAPHTWEARTRDILRFITSLQTPSL